MLTFHIQSIENRRIFNAIEILHEHGITKKKKKWIVVSCFSEMSAISIQCEIYEHFRF